MVLKCVRLFAGCFALSLGLVGPGGPVAVRAGTLLVDDFSVVGTPPAASTNSWNEGTLSGVLGGSREQTKSGSGANNTRVWSNTPAGSLSLTSTVTTNTWKLVYDGAANGSLTNVFNPVIDIYQYWTLDLDLTQTSATPGNILLTLTTVDGNNAALNWTATQTVNMPSGSGRVSFDLTDNITGLFNPVELRRIELRFQNFGPGKITLDNLAFNGPDPVTVPEPSSLALATCGVLALFAVRRRR